MTLWAISVLNDLSRTIDKEIVYCLLVRDLETPGLETFSLTWYELILFARCGSF